MVRLCNIASSPEPVMFVCKYLLYLHSRGSSETAFDVYLLCEQ